MSIRDTLLEGKCTGGRIYTEELWGGEGTDGVTLDLGASFIHGCFLENPVYNLAQVTNTLYH